MRIYLKIFNRFFFVFKFKKKGKKLFYFSFVWLFYFFGRVGILVRRRGELDKDYLEGFEKFN
jgi:hypothetical protein